MSALQQRTVQGPDGEVLTYLDHPELHAAGRIRDILNAAETTMRSADGAALTDESLMFKSLHACTCALDKSRGKKGYARRTRRALQELRQRILEYLVRENIGLVYTMRAQARIADADPDDLFSEGLWRLFQAVRRFDPWLGFRFSTYACTSILRGFVSLRRKNRLSRDTIARVCDDMVASPVRAADMNEVDNQCLAEQVRELVLSESADLTANERFVIARRLLHPPNAPPDTLEAIGMIFRLSKEGVRQIQLKALRKLRCVIDEDGSGRSAAGEPTDVLPSRRRHRQFEYGLASEGGALGARDQKSMHDTAP